MTRKPLIVGLGGTLRDFSSTEKALRIALDAAEAQGCETELIAGRALDLPPYSPEDPSRTESARRLIHEIRRADGVILGSPGYHGGMSGLVKNAIDYIEDLREDARPYLEGRAVGVVATGGGWQGAVTTMNSLRDVVHALRGWNTPLGVAVNTAEPVFSPDGDCEDAKIRGQLEALGRQVAAFARATLDAAA
ncbi:NAD(P)H-dependent oxidoreductase [Albimonas sp. CAU 1670]|uniref:NADPH-dependent FMN reductase n=1 Tax=Albimonas sp. CAU 1670 TaxID=3032599 RepID=UPI0023DBAB64|nr:NAD(P)H-dependent oxidoreductase [Albimonas sp. CAU 1670]MDF2233849.1 NAD(P)H-dependent oxidoreductase [Albimonas sp. CAU 1670]